MGGKHSSHSHKSPHPPHSKTPPYDYLYHPSSLEATVIQLLIATPPRSQPPSTPISLHTDLSTLPISVIPISGLAVSPNFEVFSQLLFNLHHIFHLTRNTKTYDAGKSIPKLLLQNPQFHPSLVFSVYPVTNQINQSNFISTKDAFHTFKLIWESPTNFELGDPATRLNLAKVDAIRDWLGKIYPRKDHILLPTIALWQEQLCFLRYVDHLLFTEGKLLYSDGAAPVQFNYLGDEYLLINEPLFNLGGSTQYPHYFDIMYKLYPKPIQDAAICHVRVRPYPLHLARAAFSFHIDSFSQLYNSPGTTHLRTSTDYQWRAIHRTIILNAMRNTLITNPHNAQDSNSNPSFVDIPISILHLSSESEQSLRVLFSFVLYHLNVQQYSATFFNTSAPLVIILRDSLQLDRCIPALTEAAIQHLIHTTLNIECFVYHQHYDYSDEELPEQTTYEPPPRTQTTTTPTTTTTPLQDLSVSDELSTFSQLSSTHPKFPVEPGIELDSTNLRHVTQRIAQIWGAQLVSIHQHHHRRSVVERGHQQQQERSAQAKTPPYYRLPAPYPSLLPLFYKMYPQIVENLKWHAMVKKMNDKNPISLLQLQMYVIPLTPLTLCSSSRTLLIDGKEISIETSFDDDRVTLEFQPYFLLSTNLRRMIHNDSYYNFITEYYIETHQLPQQVVDSTTFRPINFLPNSFQTSQYNPLLRILNEFQVQLPETPSFPRLHSYINQSPRHLIQFQPPVVDVHAPSPTSTSDDSRSSPPSSTDDKLTSNQPQITPSSCTPQRVFLHLSHDQDRLVDNASLVNAKATCHLLANAESEHELQSLQSEEFLSPTLSCIEYHDGFETSYSFPFTDPVSESFQTLSYRSQISYFALPPPSSQSSHPPSSSSSSGPTASTDITTVAKIWSPDVNFASAINPTLPPDKTNKGHRFCPSHTHSQKELDLGPQFHPLQHLFIPTAKFSIPISPILHLNDFANEMNRSNNTDSNANDDLRNNDNVNDDSPKQQPQISSKFHLTLRTTLLGNILSKYHSSSHTPFSQRNQVLFSLHSLLPLYHPGIILLNYFDPIEPVIVDSQHHLSPLHAAQQLIQHCSHLPIFIVTLCPTSPQLQPDTVRFPLTLLSQQYTTPLFGWDFDFPTTFPDFAQEYENAVADAARATTRAATEQQPHVSTTSAASNNTANTRPEPSRLLCSKSPNAKLYQALLFQFLRHSTISFLSKATDWTARARDYQPRFTTTSPQIATSTVSSINSSLFDDRVVYHIVCQGHAEFVCILPHIQQCALGHYFLPPVLQPKQPIR